jgi:TatD DNase family protein
MSSEPLRAAYVDTHTHFLDQDPLAAGPAIARALAAGVGRLLAPAVDRANCTTVLAVASAHDHVFAAVGIHPNSLSLDDDFEELALLARHPRVRAIGETGLDYYRDHVPADVQRRGLERHLELAADTGLPVILHNREADDDLLALLRSFASRVRGVLHCFSGTRSVAESFLDLGYYLSFAGNLTYASATALRAVAAVVPADRLLVETDAPYLSPVPLRGKVNEPANVLHTVRALAACRGVAPDCLAMDLATNAHRLFGW